MGLTNLVQFLALKGGIPLKWAFHGGLLDLLVILRGRMDISGDIRFFFNAISDLDT